MPKKKSKKPEKIDEKLSRPPIVTIMGHVDHGKTSLLDAIRKTNVAGGEFGGITQSIGAYQVQVKTKEGERKITFIDTPGHEAFEKMRSRGATITDIVVIVIDSKDGVMPQTKESIDHCQIAKVPFLIALNKIDLPDSDPERVKRQLSKEYNVLVEGYGGDIVCVPISAKSGKGIDDLLEMIVLTAQMKGITADPNEKLEAFVIESKLDSHSGPIASAIVKNGTLKIGDVIHAEKVKGKVRNLINDKGERVKEAPPGTPIEVQGFEKVPPVGTKIERGEKEEEPEVVEEKEMEMKLPEIKPQKLNCIIKTDTLGSLEAITPGLPENIEIIKKGVGEIGDSDILLAKTSRAIVIGFNVKYSPNTQKLAESERVLVRVYKIIYELLEELKEAGKLKEEPKESEKILGKAKIIAKFPSEKNFIAGSKVIEGRMARNDMVRILHLEESIGTRKIFSMRHAKENIAKAELGTECGIILEPPIDFSIGDMIISYRKIQ